MRLPSLLRVATTAALLLAPGAASLASPPAAGIEQRVGELLGRMTLEEKVGQLNLASNNPQFDWGEVTGGHVGGVLSFATPEEIARIQAAARSSRLGIPLLVGLDVVHGLRTIFPLGLAEAASFDPALGRIAAEIAAREASALGFNWTFAPVADLSRDPRWGRTIEGFGEDPLLGRLFTRARVEGYRAGGLATTLKHFAGYGAATGGRDYDAAEISTSELFNTYLPPFRAGIEAGSDSVMSAFHTLNGVPATANSRLLTTILRERWGFDGLVVSDWAAIEQLLDHGVASNPAEATVKALLAGVDMDMATGFYRRHLAAEVRAGRVPEAAVTEAARRVLRTKMRMGLFDRQPGPPTAFQPPSAEAREAARNVARDTLVLLRNTGVLPLGETREAPPGSRIALVGAMAASKRALIGPHEALAHWDDGVTLLEGLGRRAERSGMSLAYAPGCDPHCLIADGFAKAVDAARAADVVVAVFGEHELMTGESGSRAYLTLPGRQSELLGALLDTGKPVVLVLMASRPIELGPLLDRLAGLVMAWYPGTEGGNAVADILFGDTDPSAKLPLSWPRTVGQLPFSYDRLPTGRPFSYGRRYTLRYVDETLSPLFPFGFGLSYTSFVLSGLEVATPSLRRDGSLEVRVRLTNVGRRFGREVVQLYARQRVGELSRPVRQLKAFEKVGLQPGETRTLTLRVPVAELGYYDQGGLHRVEPGPYDVFIGTSSEASERATVNVAP